MGPVGVFLLVSNPSSATTNHFELLAWHFSPIPCVYDAQRKTPKFIWLLRELVAAETLAHRRMGSVRPLPSLLDAP